MEIKIDNLKRMIEHLKTVKNDMFGMEIFREGYEDEDQTPECKTVGCVIGHCTILDSENINKNYIRQGYVNLKLNISYAEWSEDFTGIGSDEPLWDFLFGSDWSKNDNTISGAVKRLEYVIENPEKAITEVNKSCPEVWETDYTEWYNLYNK